MASMLALVLALLPLLAAPSHAVARAGTPGVLFAQSPCTPVYTAPSRSAVMITQLLGGTDVSVLSAGTTADWTHVHIWSGVEGYIPSKGLGGQPPDHAREGTCTFPGLSDTQAEDPRTDPGPWPLSATGALLTSATLHSKPDNTSPPVGAFPAEQPLTISEWTSGADHAPWYHAKSAAADGWVWSGSVRLDLPDPATRVVQGQPIWAPVGGKGMWFTNYLPHHADVGAVMRAAKAAGITHIYTEVAISRFGFYAPNTLDRLLPAAHAANIKVIAWVYPDLKDVAADVRLAQRVATYKTPSGDRPDGLASDIEELTTSGVVFAYGQALRGVLGPDALMVATVLHPFARTGYPYAAIAASFNVLAPMNYWHFRAGRSYDKDNVRNFVTTSIFTVRAALNITGTVSQLPIEELGQTWDMFTDDSTKGQDAPTAEELTADMDTAHALGCIGVSFYEWQTATQEQWAAIAAYTW